MTMTNASIPEYYKIVSHDGVHMVITPKGGMIMQTRDINEAEDKCFSMNTQIFSHRLFNLTDKELEILKIALPLYQEHYTYHESVAIGLLQAIDDIIAIKDEMRSNKNDKSNPH